jgi:hypothetical protein
MYTYINADFQTYDLLKKFFIGVGHDVENPNYFFMDDINKIKENNKTRPAK